MDSDKVGSAQSGTAVLLETISTLKDAHHGNQ